MVPTYRPAGSRPAPICPRRGTKRSPRIMGITCKSSAWAAHCPCAGLARPGGFANVIPSSLCEARASHEPIRHQGMQPQRPQPKSPPARSWSCSTGQSHFPQWQLQPACAPSAGCNRHCADTLDKVPRLKAVTEAPPELSAGKYQRSPTSSRPVSTANWFPRHPQRNQPVQQ